MGELKLMRDAFRRVFDGQSLSPDAHVKAFDEMLREPRVERVLRERREAKERSFVCRHCSAMFYETHALDCPGGW